VARLHRIAVVASICLPRDWNAPRASADALSAVLETIDAERQCCRFLRFDITVEPDGGPIWLELAGPPGTREFLAALLEV